ncbi:hypothetical protein [Streptomyces sp. WAC06614]|uniref:hypothetical protein n=1 Tax=Streptomyces sp. WAC06614 TaxID=2487416 RepID=UPI000F7B5A95|nr:hypothetical protein [Streptomyces sp. WAC06614]RSS68501.1 hypothetical protein EF918_28225 [Streptomyces sp. WAC06614]
MSRDDQGRTSPSQAPGEAGDRAARKEAEEALAPGHEDGEGGDALTPNTGAQQDTARTRSAPDRDHGDTAHGPKH